MDRLIERYDSFFIDLFSFFLQNVQFTPKQITAINFETSLRTGVNIITFFCLSDFQSHHPKRLLHLHVNYIQLQRKVLNFTD